MEEKKRETKEKQGIDRLTSSSSGTVHIHTDTVLLGDWTNMVIFGV